MPIPETQLDTWSNPGASTTAKETADSVKNALGSYGPWPEGIEFEVYLQGSYRNGTNIRGDSDVDVVAQLNSSFYSNLTEEQKPALGISPASYDWHHFRTDSLAALASYYGPKTVSEGNKSIKLAAQSGRLPADVVVSAQFRNYRTASYGDYAEGMCFWPGDHNGRIINYPKLHYQNGVMKNSAQETDGRFKRTVRVFKNARTYLTERNEIPDYLAPSYFVECLLYNVPSDKFSGSLQETFAAAFNWLWTEVQRDSLVCQNGQSKLLGNAPGQWRAPSAKRFLEALRDLWRHW